METSGIVLLVVSASISFGLGRGFVYFRNKKRKAAQALAQKRATQALRDAPPQAASKNKSKRKRQQVLQRSKDAGGH